MALIPKKTYSKIQASDGSQLNISDPFDKLLSSPLKQNVNFKPLSYWNRTQTSDDISTLFLDSPNGRKFIKLSNFSIPKTTKNKVSGGKAQGAHVRCSKASAKSSSKLNQGLNKSCSNRLESMDIGLDHYQYITFKRSLDYHYPSVFNESLLDSTDKYEEYWSEKSSLDESTSEKWKTYIIDNKHALLEEEDNEDSTLKCTIIDGDENNNETWNIIEAMGGSSMTSTESELNPGLSQPITESITTLVNEMTDMKISSSSTPRLPHVTRRYRHTMASQNDSHLPHNKSKCLKSKNRQRNSRFSGVPMFESTRIELEDGSEGEGDMTTLLKTPVLETSIALRPGKQWRRSMSVLRNLQKSQFTNQIICSGAKGRHYETFVKELMDLQEEIQETENTAFDGSGDDGDVTTIERISNNMTVVSERKDVTSFEHSLRRKSIMNHTVKFLEDSFDKSDIAFRTAMENQNNISVFQGSMSRLSPTRDDFVSAKEIILELCHGNNILPFDKYFNEKTLKNCRKIGEGVFGEVFMTDDDSVFKVIPIEGEDEVNGEPQKNFEQILSEVIIASELSELREEGKNQTPGFSRMKRCWCVIGKYPEHLLDLWKKYDAAGNGSENDSPEMFKSDQLYIILELENGGKDLESFEFNSAEQCLAIFVQTAFTLAVAERVFEFEHRDLHWGNLLIKRTQEKFMTVVLDGVRYELPTKGVVVSIIDFTLSRILHAGCCLFNDLSIDPTLFTSQGDYQFEIYRMMQRELGNDWSLYRPRNNIYWLHYVIDKMLKMARYKNRRTQVHKKYMKELKILESVVLEYDNCSDFVLNMGLGSG